MAAQMCPQCGTPRVGSFRFCRKCGFDFDGSELTTPKPPASVAPATAPPSPQPSKPASHFGLSGSSVGARKPTAFDRWWSARSRRTRWIVVAVVALLVLGIIGNVTSPTKTPAASQAAVVLHSTEIPQAAAAAPSPAVALAATPVTMAPTAAASGVATPIVTPMPVTGFGATTSAWNAAHVPDPNFPGQMYEPDPSIGGSDRYFAMATDGGRITGYTMHIAPMDLDLAEAQALSELPADTRVLWTARLNTCVAMELESATLATVLTHLGDKRGEVFTTLDTVDFSSAAPPTFVASRIDRVILAVGSFASAAQSPGCPLT